MSLIRREPEENERRRPRWLPSFAIADADERQDVRLRRLGDDTELRIARNCASAIVQAEKAGNIASVGRRAMREHLANTEVADSVATDLRLRSELQSFVDLVRLGNTEILADTIDILGREGKL